MIFKAYVIRCLTNMHVGSGDTTFGVIDNLVQRDPVTKYPIINSSSIKGALREFFNEKKNPKLVEYIFGSKNNSESQKPGKFRFFSGNLLSIPARSDHRPYYSATTSSIFTGMIDLFGNFNIQSNDENFKKLANLIPQEDEVFTIDENIEIEGFKSVQKEIPSVENITDGNPAIFCEKNYKDLIKYLPVVARNHLENGESKNLWYEEIVPRESRFIVIIGQSDNVNYRKEFDDMLTDNVVQIGGNASIGYGFVEIKELAGIGGEK
jgi:CRISPR-associated protein Cmr4